MATTQIAMKLIAYVALLASASIASAQTPPVSVHSRIKLPQDSVEGIGLVASLDQLLAALELDVEDNPWIYSAELVQTAILMDEIKELAGSQEPKPKGEALIECRPHLSNVVPLGSDQHFVQLSYIGMAEGEPVLVASVELIARKGKDGYLFSSPLARNTKDWEVLRLGNMTFHYRGEMNVAKAKEYHGLVTAFDGKLDSAPEEVAFYFFEDDLEVQQAIGLPYKLEYNGEGGGVGWSAVLRDHEVHLMGEGQFASFDPHDLWHNRLSKVKPRKEVNHAVDEGIATLYGGCWGLTWAEMFAAFQKKIDVSEGTDWLDLRKRKVAFEERGHQNPSDFMVNALLVKRIEREKGFSGVWELLNAKEEEAYFGVLARLTGIDRQNYNVKVWGLLAAEMEALGG